jgi:predicted nuclease of predicted toxin-antitoxin system
MKFLLDQNADFRLIPHLRQLGHDVAAVSRDYPPGLPDEDVLTIARKEKRILIVADRDFGELIFQRGLVPLPRNSYTLSCGLARTNTLG